jgi:hypothetical protein
LDRWGDERHRLGLTPILRRYGYERWGARDFLAGARRTSDGHVYLANLRQLDGGWLATRCELFVAGKLTPTEEYQDWKASVELSPGRVLTEERVHR